MSWRRVWRHLAAQLSTDSLVDLQRLLETGDPLLIQGANVQPPPVTVPELANNQPADREPVGACLIGWLGLQSGCRTTLDVQRWCDRAWDSLVEEFGESEADAFYRWYDDTPLADVRAALLAEIKVALATKELAPCV